MAVSKARKSDILATLENDLKGATSVAFTSNTKLTVEEITNIRRELLKVDAKLMLAKKTLIRIAFKNVYSVDLSEDIMPGQVAILISKGDKIAGFSVLNKFANELRKDEKIKFVGGYIDGDVLDAAGAMKLASLPSREVLLAKLLGSMKAPISALARFLDGAKKEIETKSVTTVGELASFVQSKTAEETKEVAAETAPVVEATPVVEEVKEETTTEEVIEATLEETSAEEVTEAPAAE